MRIADLRGACVLTRAKDNQLELALVGSFPRRGSRR